MKKDSFDYPCGWDMDFRGKLQVSILHTMDLAARILDSLTSPEEDDMIRSRRRGRKLLWFVLLPSVVAVLVGADIRHAVQQPDTGGTFVPLSAFGVPGRTAKTKVAIVRSDDPMLPEPVAVTRALSYEQVEAMTRRAVELAGGFDRLIHAGDQVLIKPCIVTPQVSRNTDVRVVKAVARLVHEAAGGDVEVVIGEGSAEPTSSELEYAHQFSKASWNELWDAGGYDELLSDPDLAGVNLRLSNLNGPREDLIYVDIPQGGRAAHNAGKVWVHKDVLNADVHITVPALKIHTFTGITVGLKNNIGLYPGTRYGFGKDSGVRRDDFRAKLIHQTDAPRDWVDEEIVDIALVAGIDFSVVDAIRCSHRQYRRNAIVAGRDVVAVDHVAARLAGVNPDDICHVTLASLAGMGTNDPQQIEIVGATIDTSWRPFRKRDHYSCDFGQSNRIWLLRGPFAVEGTDDPISHPFIPDETAVQPQPATDGWTEPIYFFDDRIDLGLYYDVRSGQELVSYAFTYFDAPRDQEAELWVGSDEAMRIYLNGEIVYDYTGTRPYSARDLVLDKVPVHIRGGDNTLMVKVLQQLRSYDFALNICEPETDPGFDGNRVFGLRFRTPPEDITAVAEEVGPGLPQGFELGQNHPNPFNPITNIRYQVPGPAYARLMIYDLLGQELRTLVDGVVEAGHHLVEWDGKDDRGRDLSTGVYLYRLEAGSFIETRKALLVR